MSVTSLGDSELLSLPQDSSYGAPGGEPNEEKEEEEEEDGEGEGRFEESLEGDLEGLSPVGLRADAKFAKARAKAAKLSAELRSRNLQSQIRDVRTKSFREAGKTTGKIVGDIHREFGKGMRATPGMLGAKGVGMKDVLPRTTKERTRQYFISEGITKVPSHVKDLSRPGKPIPATSKASASLVSTSKKSGSLTSVPSKAASLAQAPQVKQNIGSTTSLTVPKLTRIAGTLSPGSTSQMKISRLGVSGSKIPQSPLRFRGIREDVTNTPIAKVQRSRYFSKKMKQLRREER